MSAELEDKSISNILEMSTDLIKEYRLQIEKILGSTPEEIKETQDALEGFTPADIREAVNLYKKRHHQ